MSISRPLLWTCLVVLLALVVFNAVGDAVLLGRIAPAPIVSAPRPARAPIAPAPPALGAPVAAQAQSLYLARLHSGWAIEAAARRWRVSASWLRAVAWCESGMSPWAYNYASGASGLFQFLPSTYAYMARQIGERRSYWNAWASANVAAWAFSRGYAGQWSCAYAAAWKLAPVGLPSGRALRGRP